MCNDYRLEVDASSIVDGFAEHQITLTFPEGKPNISARADIKISDVAPIVRGLGRTSGELVQRRWSWPGPNRKPVYNFRSEGREFTRGRCLIVADGFYEFTAPDDPGKKRKDKWLFTMRGEPWFCIAGIWQASAEAGEAFTMLTLAPGPDVAPYHDRQIAILNQSAWSDWLDPSISAKQILKPLPAGSLAVEQIG